jgi:cell division protein FtsI/penicillin-binding protein 2
VRLQIFATVALLMSTSACGLFGSNGPSAEDAAKQFVATWSGGDAANAAKQTDSADSAKKLMDRVRGSLKPTAVTGDVQKVDTPGDGSTGKAQFTMNWDLGRNRHWTYAGEFELRKDGDNWKVHWAPSVIHPKLAEQQSIQVIDLQPTLAPVLDRDGGVLLEPNQVISVLLDRQKAGDLPAVAGELASALSPLDNTITKQAIIDGATKTPDGQPYLVAALRDPSYQQVKPIIHDLPGVRFTGGARLLPTDKAFATQLVPGVRKVVEDQVAGKSGWRVVSVDGAGAEVEELFAKPAEPAQAVTATLSRGIQNAAQAAIANAATPATIVAIQPSTGEILAVAQNAAADKAGSLGLSGRYPPGSTFKIATAVAALEGGTVNADSAVGCPGTVTIDGRQIPNHDKFDKGTIPLHSAFAFSCNTTFASLAADMPNDSLTNAARKLGIGVDFVVPGVTTVTGSVPPASAKVERAEDGFGQGKVVVSPFGLALAASTVASGTMPKPILVRGTETKADNTPTPISGPVLEAMRAMMREVVTDGTAGALEGLGDVRGKTGTAQFGDGTHSHGWFAGYRGDLAFAVLITDAGGSAVAVQATARFLNALK